MPTQNLTLSDSPGFHWTAEYHENLSRLEALDEQNCRMRAFSNWVRIPFLAEVEGRLVAGDARYDRGKKSFATIELDPNLGCPVSIPDWERPFWRRLGIWK